MSKKHSDRAAILFMRVPAVCIISGQNSAIKDRIILTNSFIINCGRGQKSEEEGKE